MPKLRNPSESDITAPVIWPNAATERWYDRELNELLAEAQADLSRRIRKAWRTNEPTIGFAQDASAVVDVRKLLDSWGKRWTARFDTMSDRIAESFARRSSRATELSMQASLKKAGFTVAFKPTRKSLEAYKAVVAENVGLIKSISAKYHDDVQGAVWAAVRGGYDLSTLSKDLRKKYGISVNRAALISRDQAAKAKATIENVRRQELGIKQAIWRHSHAGKVPRPTHVAMSGKVFDLDKGMWDSAEGKFVFPGELINCRCSSSPLIAGLEKS